MAWFAPLFFTGLAALAVPVLVHLVRREEHDALAFPSLMFLERIHSRVRDRRTLRHPWLLVLRCLALALVVAAFAGPHWLSAPPVIGTNTERDRVILLDRSYSMGAAGTWERARAEARAALAELSPGQRAALIVFDHDTKVLRDLDADLAGLAARLDGARPGVGHTNLMGALERAGGLLASSRAARRDIVLVSDLQRGGMERDGDVRLPPGVQVEVRRIELDPGRNAAVASVRVAHERLGNGDAITLTARIVDTGALPAGAVGVHLEVDGVERGRSLVNLDSGASAEVSFPLVVGGERPSRARIWIDPDSLPGDDSHGLVLARAAALPVLRLLRAEVRAGHPVHLERALAQGTRPVFELSTRDVADFDPDLLARHRVIIVDDAPIPGGRAGVALARFVASGGGLLVITGDGVQGTWPGGPDGIVPGSLGRTRSLENAGPLRLSNLDIGHPALAAFSGDRGGDLAGGLVYRYRTLDEVPAEAVVATYGDGAVALAERRVGLGRVLVLTTALDPYWNTLPTLPGFLPLMHDMVKYLGAYVPASPSFAVGDVMDLTRYARGLSGRASAAAALGRGASVSVRTPAGEETAPDGALLRLDEAGFYEAHVSGGGESLVFAANPRIEESYPAPVAVAEFMQRIARVPALPARAGEGEDSALTRGDPRGLWWFALLAGVLLFALETRVGNSLSTRRRGA